jgi:drug/metabolite transporter (DMT)-like permease
MWFVALAFGVSVAWGAFTLLQKVTLDAGLPVQAVFVASTVVYGLVGAALALARPRDVMAPFRDRPWLAWKLVGGSVALSLLPYLVYLWVLRNMDSYIVAALVSIAPVTTALLGVWLLQERMTVYSMAGVVLILAGVLLIGWHQHISQNL